VAQGLPQGELPCSDPEGRGSGTEPPTRRQQYRRSPPRSLIEHPSSEAGNTPACARTGDPAIRTSIASWGFPSMGSGERCATGSPSGTGASPSTDTPTADDDGGHHTQAAHDGKRSFHDSANRARKRPRFPEALSGLRFADVVSDDYRMVMANRLACSGRAPSGLPMQVRK